MPSYARKHQLSLSLTYHVFNRSNRRLEIFHEKEDFEHFIKLLKKYVQRFEVKIYNWVIMTNHYHILIELDVPEYISKMMAGEKIIEKIIVSEVNNSWRVNKLKNNSRFYKFRHPVVGRKEKTMGWPKRWHMPGLIYHVVIRGNNRQAVFLEAEDYRRYLSCLYHYKKKYGFKLFAFCLMSNHVHLLIQVNEVRISKIMQGLTIAHTKHYHFKYQCCGHVWQGRFKSPIVSDDEYLLCAMSYVEQNPLRARMVEKIEDYPWSSYKLNIRQKDSGIIDRQENPAWLKLGANYRARIKGYKDYVATRIEEGKTIEIQKGTRGQGHYFSKRFEEQIKEMLPRKRKPGRPRKVEFIVN